MPDFRAKPEDSQTRRSLFGFAANHSEAAVASTGAKNSENSLTGGPGRAYSLECRRRPNGQSTSCGEEDVGSSPTVPANSQNKMQLWWLPRDKRSCIIRNMSKTKRITCNGTEGEVVQIDGISYTLVDAYAAGMMYILLHADGHADVVLEGSPNNFTRSSLTWEQVEEL